MPKRKDENAPYWRMIRDYERQIITYALEQGHTITKTARLLGISVNYLSERTRELGVAPDKSATKKATSNGARKRPTQPAAPQADARPALTLVASDENEADDWADVDLEEDSDDGDDDSDDGDDDGDGDEEGDDDDDGDGDDDDGDDSDEGEDGDDEGENDEGDVGKADV